MNQIAPAKACTLSEFAADLIDGLSKTPKQTSPKWFYDADGSALFAEITRVPEYYPTRTETALLAARAGDMARAIGPGRAVVEYGSGSADKAALILGALENPAGYVCVEIDPGAAQATAAAVSERFPGLRVRGVAGDFTRLDDTAPPLPATLRLGFFPGSTIGNFAPDEAVDLLSAMRRHLGEGARFLLGADLIKDPAVLEAAYDDAGGVTARFNLNLLARANRELGADFDLSAFRHRSVWNPGLKRVEMHLVSLRDQTAHICGHAIRFAEGETIHTESAHKFDREALEKLAAAAGWRLAELWTDPDGLFAEVLLT